MKAMKDTFETKKAGNTLISSIGNRSDIEADLEVEFEHFDEG